VSRTKGRGLEGPARVVITTLVQFSLVLTHTRGHLSGAMGRVLKLSRDSSYTPMSVRLDK